MAERIRRALGGALVPAHGELTPFIGTFHSLGAKILRKEAKRFRRSPRFVIFDDDDSLKLIKKCAKEISEGTGDIGPALLCNLVSKLKEGSREFDTLRLPPRLTHATLRELYDAYERALERNDAFDFDDLIEKAVVLFQTKPEVLAKYQSQLKYLLVDEYQDLNKMQYQLIAALGRAGSILNVVGDDQQMIYGWRGSDIGIFLNFERDWPSSTTVLLEENYRSTGNIISAASRLIGCNEYQKPKMLWTKNSSGSRIRVVETEGEDDEAEWIAKQLDMSKFRNIESAILYRTNAQSRAIEQALLAREIPYRLFGGVKFYERKEIKDMIAALRLAANPKEEISRERLAKTLPRRAFQGVEEALRGRAELPPAHFLERFLAAADYFAYLERNFVNAEERKENIAELLAYAQGFREVPIFLEKMALLQDTDEVAKRQAPLKISKYRYVESALRDSRFAVNLMTIHLAKGLEFDHVYIAGASEGLLPHARSLSDEQQLEEERRLMYVAMTRAKQELAVSFYDLPSRFLSEIPEEHTELAGISLPLDAEERYITLE
jgi:DNA helicase-2/ATP-dependent DNA helicase PcrA